MSIAMRAKVLLASVIFRQKKLNRWAHQQLPTKRLASCVMLFDEAGRLLLVKPTYRPDWLVPGGVVERDESPWEGARREVEEEIGLVVGPLRLAAMDWRSSDDEYDDSLHFVFHGGALTADQQAALRPDGVEIAECRFAAKDDAARLLDPYLSARLMPCWDFGDGRALILSRGEPDSGAF